MSRLIVLLAGAALAATAVPAAAVNLIVNGGFETTTTGPGQFDYQTVALGWTSTGYNFIFGPGTGDTTGSNGVYGNLSLWGTNNGGTDVFVDSPTGGNFVAADGAFGVAPVEQTLTGLIVGRQYAVEFDWAAAQQFSFNGDTTEKWIVSLGSQSISTATYANPNHGFSGWMHEKIVFTAQNTSDVLSFLAVGTPDGLPPFSLLDGVSANAVAVPEAATWAMMIAGFGLVGFAARRRRATVVAA